MPWWAWFGLGMLAGAVLLTAATWLAAWLSGGTR